MSGNAYSVMIDVRTDEEWRAGYIEGAIHIPLSEIKNDTKKTIKSCLKELQLL